MENFSINAGSYHLLNEAEVPFKSRLKLCRLLWASKDIILPKKHQLLLSWLGGNLSSQVDSPYFNDAAKTLMKILISRSLADELPELRSVIIKPNVAQAISEYLRKQDQNKEVDDTIKCLQTIGEILITKEWITCIISSQFEALSRFTSAWLQYVKLRLLKKEADLTTVQVVLKHVVLLLEKTLKLMKGYNASKTVLAPFCKHLLLPVLELHCICTKIAGVDDVSESFLAVLTKVISTALFTGENMRVYEDLVSEEFGTKVGDKDEEMNRRTRKFQRAKRLNLVMGILRDILTEESLGVECIVVFFKLFLTHGIDVKTEVKIKMLQELTKISCLHLTKCQDITCCDNLNVALLHGLLKMADSYRLYQPAVNQDISGNLLQWLRKITESLVTSYKPCCNWISCIMVMSEIDKSIVEPRMKSILLKSVGKNALKRIQIKNIFDLVHCLVDVYIKIRQSARLVNILILVIESSVHSNTIKDIDAERLVETMEEFGDYLGKMCSVKLTPSLVVEIWTTVLHKILNQVKILSENTTASLDEKSIISTLDSLHLLFKFFRKVVLKTPVFALWNHLTVREKFVKNLRTFKEAVNSLKSLLSTNVDGTKPKEFSAKVAENFILASLLDTELMNTLERYIVTTSGDITPGVQNVFYNNENTFDVNSIDTTAIEYSSLPTNDSKLNLIRLELLRIRKMSQDIAVTDLLMKTHNEVVVEKYDAMQKDLKNMFERLEIYLQSVDLETGTTFSSVFELLVKSFSILQERSTIQDWIISAIVIIMFGDNNENDGCKMLIGDLFDRNPGNSITSSLLQSSAKKLSEYVPNEIVPPFIKSTKSIKSIYKNQEVLPILNESKIVLKGIKKYLNILKLVKLRNLSVEQALPVFVHLLRCIKIVESIFKMYPDLKDSVFKNLLLSMLQIVGNKGIDILGLSKPQEVFKYFLGIQEFVDDDLRDSINALLQESIFAFYHCSSTAGGKTSKIVWKKNEDSVLTMEELSHRINALINILSFGNENEFSAGKKLQSGCRKRKLRNEIQICKKLRLDSDKEVENVTSNDLFKELKFLYQDAVKFFKKKKKDLNKSQYKLLSSCISAYNLMKLNDDFSEVIIDENIKNIFKYSVNSEFFDSDHKTSMAKFRFIGSCLQLKEIDYVYDKSHLKNLIKYLENDLQCQQTLERCIMCFLSKVPVECVQEDVLNEIILNIRCSKGENINKIIRFTSTVLDSGLLNETGRDEDDKISRSVSSRFVKSLLESLTILLTETSHNIDSSDVSTLISANQIISKIIRMRWMRLQAIEICNIFDAMLGTPLEKIYGLKGTDQFYEVFQTCYDITHCIIIHHKDIGRITAICNAAFRMLLKAAMLLGKQRPHSQKETITLRHDKSYKMSIKCAGLLEKLFQLIADNYKKEFSKCISYVVGDYICIVTSHTIVPFVKKFFTSAIYHLVSMMDEFDVAMIRKALPPVVRDVFQTLYVDYGRNFKYKGFV